MATHFLIWTETNLPVSQLVGHHRLLQCLCSTQVPAGRQCLKLCWWLLFYQSSKRSKTNLPSLLWKHFAREQFNICHHTKQGGSRIQRKWEASGNYIKITQNFAVFRLETFQRVVQCTFVRNKLIHENVWNDVLQLWPHMKSFRLE